MPQSKPVSTLRVVWTSFFVDALDIVINLIVMVLTGSVVLLAELIQGISDLTASSFLLIGLKRPRRETRLWILASALMMLLVASSLSFYFGLQRFLNPEPIDNLLLAYVGLMISIISNGYAFMLSVRRILKKNQPLHQVISVYRRSSLLMTKNTFVLDLMGMSAAIVGLIALILYQLVGDIRYDGVGAMAIGIVLGLLALNLVINLKNTPIGKAAELEL